MKAAHMAGIEVFVTGGIGGVHRNVHTSMYVHNKQNVIQWMNETAFG